MIGSEKILHDLKSERDGITKPLPRILILVPIALFLSVGAAVFLNISFLIKKKESEELSAQWKLKAESEYSEKAFTEKQIDLIKNQDRKAEEIIKWINGSKQIQPLALCIARSMGQKSSIEELLLYRDDKNPHQVRIELKFINGGQKQLDVTLSAINSIGYRAYSANQNLAQGGKVDYQATLIWQDNHILTKELSFNNEQ